MNSKYLYYLIVTLICISSVNAHILAGESGLSSGMTHPLFGLDHLLAMIAVGIISVQIGRKAIWLLPLTFVSVMVVGGILGILGIKLMGVEYGIAFSVIILGIAIALARKFPIIWAMIFVAIFALFHGHAHGEELPSIASPILYVLGFVFVTTLLHISGILIGHYAKKTQITQKLLQGIGIAVSMIGVYFLMIV